VGSNPTTTATGKGPLSCCVSSEALLSSTRFARKGLEIDGAVARAVTDLYMKPLRHHPRSHVNQA